MITIHGFLHRFPCWSPTWINVAGGSNRTPQKGNKENGAKKMPGTDLRIDVLSSIGAISASKIRLGRYAHGLVVHRMGWSSAE
jgi:hypothetical protein